MSPLSFEILPRLFWSSAQAPANMMELTQGPILWLSVEVHCILPKACYAALSVVFYASAGCMTACLQCRKDCLRFMCFIAKGTELRVSISEVLPCNPDPWQKNKGKPFHCGVDGSYLTSYSFQFGRCLRVAPGRPAPVWLTWKMSLFQRMLGLSLARIVITERSLIDTRIFESFIKQLHASDRSFGCYNYRCLPYYFLKARRGHLNLSRQAGHAKTDDKFSCMQLED